MNILVVGGAGYIGSHTCKALKNAGYNPVVYDSFIYGHRDFIKWGPFEEGDILDEKRLEAVMGRYRPEAVIHFAAFAYVGESMEQPAKYYRNNVTGTLTLLDAMRNFDIHKIVFSSSCATYGIPIAVPIVESHPQNPVNPYGQTKLVVETMLKDFDSAYGLKSISLRYFNAAGADPDGEIGEDHTPETHLIPLILDAASGKRPRVTIYGKDYDTSDGTCIRDYIHVTDLAQAHLSALRALGAGAGSTAYNLGNGKGYSILEVIETIKKISGREIPYVFGTRRQGDPACLVADAAKAIRELNWKPEFHNLDLIVKHAWEWHRKRFASS